MIEGTAPVRAGDVLVSEATAGAPEGLLRRVVAVERTGSASVVRTVPGALTDVFAQAGMPRRVPPPLPDCQGGGQPAGDPPRITSPLKGSSYRIRMARLGDERIAFTATADASSRTLYWFVDDAYLGSAANGQPLMWAPERTGRFLVRVVDDQGRTDSRALDVGAVE